MSLAYFDKAAFRKMVRVGSASIIVAIGLLQMVGYATGWAALGRAGAMTAASPVPVVFTHINGIETFALSVEMTVMTEDGLIIRRALDSEMSSRLRGPMTRRNPYTNTMTYWPTTAQGQPMQEMMRAALHYGICKAGILSEIGIATSVRQAIIRGRSKIARARGRMRNRDMVWTIAIDCGERQ
jgi:hypothetical protein